MSEAKPVSLQVPVGGERRGQGPGGGAGEDREGEDGVAHGRPRPLVTWISRLWRGGPASGTLGQDA